MNNKKKVLILVVLICLLAAVAVVLGVVLSRSNDTPNGEETTNKPNESTASEKDDSKSTESTTSRLESDYTDAGTAEAPEPTESTTNPTEPGTKESEPAESTTKPTEPGTKEPEPTESATKPTEPESTEPETKPAETEPHIHSFGEWKIVKDSTCKETGTKERVCPCGQKQTESIAKKEHVSDGSNDGIPTISANGNTATVEIVCSTCNSKVQIPYSGTYLDGENAYSFKDGKRQKLSDGFFTYKGNTYYIVSNIIIKNYYIIDGKVYDFGNNGILVDSVLDKVIVTVGQKQYYVVGNVVQKSGYANVNGQYYELGTDGAISQHSHSFVNGVCKCGASKSASIGLGFYPNGNGYAIIRIGNCTDTDIIIPSEYKGKPVTVIREYAFYECTNITSITIPNSVTNIRDSAFGYCSSLTSILIPNSVTSIESFVFRHCVSLTSIEIPNSVESIKNGAFHSCTNLTNITIPNSVISIDSNTFYNCTNLTSITFDGTMAQWNAISKGDFWDYNTGSYTITCTDGTITTY